MLVRLLKCPEFLVNMFTVRPLVCVSWIMIEGFVDFGYFPEDDLIVCDDTNAIDLQYKTTMEHFLYTTGCPPPESDRYSAYCDTGSSSVAIATGIDGIPYELRARAAGGDGGYFADGSNPEPGWSGVDWPQSRSASDSVPPAQGQHSESDTTQTFNRNALDIEVPWTAFADSDEMYALGSEYTPPPYF
jgi:hypothetical protein